MQGIIYKNFKEITNKFPNQKIVIENESYTFQQLLDRIEQKVLQLEPYSHIGVFLENGIEFIELLLLASKYHLTLIPFANRNINFEKFDIEYIFDGKLYKYKDFKDKESGYIIVSTSGSTSEPKPIVLTEEIKLKRIEIAKKTYNLSEKDTILVSTPMHHSLALRGVLMSLVLGAKLVLLKNFKSDNFLKTITKEKVTFTFAVSNQLEIIKDKLDDYDLSSLNSLISTSYSLNPDTKKKLLKYTNVYECYGTSEIGCVTKLSSSDIISHPNSVGQTLEGCEIKIKENEILVKSPWRFKEYYNLEEVTKKSFDKEFFKTGDIGEILDNYLYYKGRNKEVIKSGGISIYPIDIEKVLRKVKGVKEVAVIGVEDEYFGEAIVAIIEGDAKKVALLEASKKLATFQRPLEYIFDTIPRNEMGKIQKFKLKEKYKSLNLGKKLKGFL